MMMTGTITGVLTNLWNQPTPMLNVVPDEAPPAEEGDGLATPGGINLATPGGIELGLPGT